MSETTTFFEWTRLPEELEDIFRQPWEKDKEGKSLYRKCKEYKHITINSKGEIGRKLRK